MPDATYLEFSTDGTLATITLGSPDERAIALNPTRIISLIDALSVIRQRSNIKGLVIRAPSLDSFCVGADIALIQGVTDPLKGAELATQGQNAFNLIADLECTTVAAISGPCVGGGCELALACDYRIASDLNSTLIGLPETKLGILPGFGGSYRLPRLIGLPKALDIILAGKTLRAAQALKVGLIDQISSANSLYKVAELIASGSHKPRRRSPKFVERFLTNTAVGRAFVRRNAMKATITQTKGFYPAPIKALNLTVDGLSRNRANGLSIEAKELGELIVTPESKSLVHLFYLTEASKNLGKVARNEVKGVQALVVGAGIMGAGIAASLAKNNHQVIVKDTSEESLERGKAHVVKGLSKIRHLSAFDKAAITNRLDWIRFNTSTIARTEVAIEAVFEDINLKKQIFAELAAKVPPHCVLATNTSSLSVDEISSSVSNPERFVGMHFFNPVEKMPLVEIIRGSRTSAATVAKVAALTTEIGKFPIVVNDVPGFLINRILIPYLNEAIYLLQEGYLIEEIDGAARKFGMPMGPIRLLDEVGLDVAAHVSKVMVAGYGERMSVAPFAQTMLTLDRKGRKNGMGFYDYQSKDCTPWKGLYETFPLPKNPINKISEQEITERLIFHLVNEAMKCLIEGVAGDDLSLAEKQIDLGTVMGIGFPPFRGGVVRFAREIGLKKIRNKLVEFEKAHGVRYQPWHEQLESTNLLRQ